MAEADFRAEALAEIRVSEIREPDQPHSMDLSLRNTDLPRRMFSLVVIPARSAVLIMEELPEGSPLAGSRASAAFTAAEVSMAAAVEAFTVVEVTAAAVTGNPVHS